MLEEDVYIREAQPEEAEQLADLACSSREPWILPVNWGDNLYSSDRIITQEFIENNPTYVLEDEQEQNIIGFYTLETHEGTCYLSSLCISPDYVGMGYGGALFMHACEIAEGLGVETLSILSKEASDGFFFHMGAEKAEGTRLPCGATGNSSVLTIRL